MKPTLAVTMGDPAGIGPEVVVKAASVPDVFEEACLVVFGDAQVLARAAREMAPTVRVERCGGLQEAFELARAGGAAQRLAVVDVGGLDDSGLDWAHPVPSSDRAQYDYIQRAFEAVQSGAAEALVTAPVSKVSINRAGVDFPGHTEIDRKSVV